MHYSLINSQCVVVYYVLLMKLRLSRTFTDHMLGALPHNTEQCHICSITIVNVMTDSKTLPSIIKQVHTLLLVTHFLGCMKRKTRGIEI